MPAHAVEIPERQDFLEALNEAGVPVAEDALKAQLGISADQLEGFERRLAAMERDGQVMRNRRGHILVADGGWLA